MSEDSPEPVVDFRPAEPADTAFARDVHTRAYHDVVVQQFGTWDENKQADFFDNAWSKPGFEIISVDGQPAGYRCVEFQDDALVIHELVISPEFQNHGIGSRLLAQAKEEAKRHGLPVRLQVLKANLASELYGRMDFEVTGETDTHLTMQWWPDTSHQD